MSLVSITTASAAASSGRVARPSVASASSRVGERVAHVVDGHRARRRDLVLLAAGGADVVARGEEDLERRVGEHDGADVATLHHSPAVRRHPGALTVDEHRAHRRVRRHLRDVRRDLGTADGGGDVATVERSRRRPRARSPRRGPPGRPRRRRRGRPRTPSPPASPRGTWRRCRGSGARARARPPGPRSTCPSPRARRWR